MRLEFHPEAELEFIEAAVHGLSADQHLRKFILTRFPFTLYYSFAADVLRIEAAAHQSRRPGYWKSRANR